MAEGSVTDFLSCFLFEKEGALQGIVHALKYDGMTSMGSVLGEEIGYSLLKSESFPKPDLLIPIPLHHLKRRERGYNQSEYLCRGISRVTGVPVRSSIVRRVRYTTSQTKLNLEERRCNMDGAFRVVPRRIPEVDGKIILIVDDVITTGATINACGNALLAAGCRKVIAASAAVAS